MTLKKASFVPVSLFVVVSALACVSDPVTGKWRYSLVNWTAAEELELGRTNAPSVESQFDALYPDREVNRDLGALVEQMVELSPRRDDFEFRFKVLNSSIPNALALPGGFVYITRGLLQELESETEFIAVLGHELGHVEHQHSMLNQGRGTLLRLPVRPLAAVSRRLPIGGRIVGAATAIVAAPSVLLGLRYSRKQELQADERGVFFSAELGYDPREFTRVFELFTRLEEESGSGSEFAVFRSHPLNKDRVAGIEKTLKREYPKLAQRPAGDFRQSSPRFLEIVQGFRERKPAYELFDRARMALVGEEAHDELLEEAREDLSAARALLPDEPLFALFEGELALASDDVAKAAEAFVEAHRLYEQRTPGDGHWKAPFYIGALSLEAGDSAVALAYLTIAEARFPLSGLILFLLGRAHEEEGEVEQARDCYQRAAELLPADSPLREEARSRRKQLS